MKKTILKYIFTYIILINLFIISLVISSCIPSKYMYQNVKETSNILLKEGNQKNFLIPYRKIIMSFDNYTDALMINTAYSIDSKTPFYSSFMARKNYIPNLTTEVYEDFTGELRSSSKYMYYNPVGELNDLVNHAKVESYEYARYWHGYLIILRPLLVLFNLQTIRIILTIILVILSIILMNLLRKKTNSIILMIFALALIWSEYFYLGNSLQGIFVFLIMIIISIIILLKNNKIKNIGILFFVTGMLANFFDFLTVPLVTLGVPLTIQFFIQKQEKTLKNILIDIIKISLSWGVGYTLTWFTKWALTDLIYNKQLIKISLEQVIYRSIGENEITRNPVLANLTIMLPGIITTLIFTIGILTIKSIINKVKINFKIDKKTIILEILPYIIIGFMPIIWYALLKNHSYMHGFFTYRNLIITNICINLCIERIYNKIIIK